MPTVPETSFDVFLSHNNRDKDAVRDLRDRLAAHRLTIWFDEDELRPGIPWQQLLEEGIRASRSVVVVVGGDGIGPWEDEEMRAALSLAVKDKRPVIPVLLPAAKRPELPLFLQNRTWVDLRPDANDETLDRLIWGITGRKKKTSGRATKAPPAERGVDATTLSSPPPPLTLETILPGSWQVQIQTPFALGALQLAITAQGSFHGELLAPMGPSMIDGTWQANTGLRQIILQGRQTAGFHVGPYYALVQVTFFDRQQIVGITAGGEQVRWQKAAPDA